jgi:Holliday junction DNA helicase RuvB
LRKATISPILPPSAEPSPSESGASEPAAESLRQESGAGLGERREEGRLRPATLAEYVGQDSIKANLKIFIQAAAGRKEPLDHVLLYGPPGLGKTTLASIIAREMGSRLKETAGPLIERAGDLAAILTNLEPGDVLFIDEIHRLPSSLEEVLYPAMEDYKLDIIVGQGAMARSVRIELPPFTLIGATTRVGLLSAPLRSRFGIVHHLNYYSQSELQTILVRSGGLLNARLAPEACVELARRARATPRIANRLLRRVRDFAEVENQGVIDLPLAQSALERLAVDPLGLDGVDRKVLLTLIEKFSGGPTGLKTLAAATGEEEDTLEETIEPFLIQIGFLERTPRGRVATGAAFGHLGLKPVTKSALFNTAE